MQQSIESSSEKMYNLFKDTYNIEKLIFKEVNSIYGKNCYEIVSEMEGKKEPQTAHNQRGKASGKDLVDESIWKEMF